MEEHLKREDMTAYFEDERMLAKRLKNILKGIESYRDGYIDAHDVLIVLDEQLAMYRRQQNKVGAIVEKDKITLRKKQKQLN
ncbi:TPA_asm: hypothetical protein GIO55_14295 [Listeria monocytogenes]|nr:hypothetical protein [Listeria monocytogenes]